METLEPDTVIPIRCETCEVIRQDPEHDARTLERACRHSGPVTGRERPILIDPISSDGGASAPGAPPIGAGESSRLTDIPPPDRTEGPPARWRILLDGDRGGAENMARDHALARELRTGTGVLRIYGWSRPTGSFGRNEPARGLYDPETADREGVAFVRRPTGGRVVLHDEELTYAVAAPLRAWGGLRGAYRAINEGLVAALRRLGAPAELAGSPEHREAPLSAGPCFQLPSEGEVVARGRKLVGSAQARVGRALLQHGSILLSGSQDPLARIGPEATAEAGARPTTLRSLLGRVPDRSTVSEALMDGLEETLGGRWERATLTAAEQEAARHLRKRYASAEWTWRR